MNKIKSYIFGALLLAMVGMVACNKDIDSSELGALGEGEGALALNCELTPKTRAVLSNEEAKERLGDYILKIYSVDKENDYEELIRYYKPAYDIPELLYLISGDYKATLSLQVDAEPTYATRNSIDYTYEGETEFTITKGEQSDVTIPCGVINSVVRMQLDATDFATNNKTEYSFDSETGSIVISGDATDEQNVVVRNIVGYVTADECTTADEVIASSEGRVLNYKFIKGYGAAGSDGIDFVCEDGYFMPYDGYNTLSYAISFEYSDKTDSEFKTYKTFGTINNIKPKTIYTLSMSCAEADRGTVGLNIALSNAEYDESDNDFNFSPQPTIAGDGIKTPFDYQGGVVTYDLKALLPMSNITITRGDGTTDTIMADGSAIEGVEGIEALEISADRLSGTLSLNNAFYSEFSNGGENGYTITITDEKSSIGKATPKAKLTGIVPTITNANYWNNTGSLTAYLAENETSESAKIYARRKGTETWYEINMENGIKQGENAANVAAVWSAGSANRGGHTKYSLNFGVAAGASYECKLEIDGVQRGGIAQVTAGGTKDLIPEANMDDKAMSCFGNSNGGSTTWGSGNNSMSSGLCTFSSDFGGCAQLNAKGGVMLVGIAPGNLFLGQFNMSGTSGKVSFGQKFTWNSRPTSFKFRYKATTGKVNESYHDGAAIGDGDQDIQCIFFAIVDWSGRHSVTSGTSKPSGVWNPETHTSVDEGKIIGYAMLDITSTTDAMNLQEIPIYYYDKVTNPSASNISIVVSCATSKYGDYLTGCTSNKLWVDNFEFGY